VCSTESVLARARIVRTDCTLLALCGAFRLNPRPSGPTGVASDEVSLVSACARLALAASLFWRDPGRTGARDDAMLRRDLARVPARGRRNVLGDGHPSNRAARVVRRVCACGRPLVLAPACSSAACGRDEHRSGFTPDRSGDGSARRHATGVDVLAPRTICTDRASFQRDSGVPGVESAGIIGVCYRNCRESGPPRPGDDGTVSSRRRRFRKDEVSRFLQKTVGRCPFSRPFLPDRDGARHSRVGDHPTKRCPAARGPDAIPWAED